MKRPSDDDLDLIRREATDNAFDFVSRASGLAVSRVEARALWIAGFEAGVKALRNSASSFDRDDIALAAADFLERQLKETKR